MRARQHRDAEGVSRPDRRLAVLRRDPGDGRQPAVPDGEGPQVGGVAVGRVVGQPADLGDAGARAGGLDDVDRVVLIWCDPDRGGPGPAAIGGIRQPADVTVARGRLGIPRGVEVAGPVGAQVAVDPPFGCPKGCLRCRRPRPIEEVLPPRPQAAAGPCKNNPRVLNVAPTGQPHQGISPRKARRI